MGFPECSEGDLNPHDTDVRLCRRFARIAVRICWSARDDMCPRGDLNTQRREISPDRGIHTIQVTPDGSTSPVTQRPVRWNFRGIRA
jgi:hypothetical protein